MIYHTDIQVRFNDTDALGHVSNIAFALYIEQARVEFFRSLGMGRIALILAHLSQDFRKQIKFGDQVYVETKVGKLGNTSVTLDQTIMASNELAAEAKSVVVLFDYEAQKPKPIADDLRQKLSDYL
jgi:acyl-CoA thioester hydrolase